MPHLFTLSSIILLALTAAIAPASPAAEPATAPASTAPSTLPAAPPGQILAWLRFDDAERDWHGTRYRTLGEGEIECAIGIVPAPGHAIDILWGSRNDHREAVMVLNGKSVQLKEGGYDGFKWLRTPVPEGALAQKNYLLTLRQPPSARAAFIAQIRLVDAAAPADAPQPVMKPAASKMSLKAAQVRVGFQGEAFPEMRDLWDRIPPEPAATASRAAAQAEARFRRAEANARMAAEGLYRCRRFVDGWLAQADPKSGLMPRNLTRDKDLWNGRDCAADNWPFMVLTCYLTDKPLFEGRMKDMLKAEIRLTQRVDRLSDDFLFSTQSWKRPAVNLDAIIFDNAEYAKDGLLPLTEFLGPSPWSDRLVGIVEDIWKHAPVETPFGKIPTLNVEVNGDLLQACARLYGFTGDKKFLDWGIRLGDYYLLGENHPTRHMERLGLMDHACEVINGLSELYVAVAHADPKKRDAYRQPLMEIYDKILEIGRNEDGLLYTHISPKTGEHAMALCDTWGYDYDGIYTAFLLERKPEYRQAVRKVLSNLKDKYVGACWADKSADGFADSIEGAINLYNREPIAPAADWIDSQIRQMWSRQRPEGVIEGWHGDGNFARTTIMHALWKSQGARLDAWRPDVRLGAVRVPTAAADDGHGAAAASDAAAGLTAAAADPRAPLYLSLAADKDWSGKLIFDSARHKTHMKLPLDYPRINQFPEWFTVDPAAQYTLHNLLTDQTRTLTGQELLTGLAIELKPNRELRLIITPK